MKGSGGFNLFTPIYLCALLAGNQSQKLLEMGNSTVPPKNQYVLHLIIIVNNRAVYREWGLRNFSSILSIFGQSNH